MSTITITALLGSGVVYTASLLWADFFNTWIKLKFPSNLVGRQGTFYAMAEIPSNNQVSAKFWLALTFTVLSVVIVYIGDKALKKILTGTPIEKIL